MKENEANEVKASNGKEIDFAAVRQYVESFKKTVGCDDVLLPSDSAFDEKFGQLSTVNVSRCGLPVDEAMKFFDGLLSLVRETKKG